MALLELNQDNALYYLYSPPKSGKPTFVFVNALTGNTGHWEAVIAPALRIEGYGTLSYNFRGQTGSRFYDVDLTPELIVSDLMHLIDAVDPTDPILVGLSIGGLFAAEAVAKGVPVKGLVLLNTLRKIGPRIAWVNDALPTLVGHGGVALFMDGMLPLLVNPDFAAKARTGALVGEYEPMDPDHGHMNLMKHSTEANWEFDWSSLTLPVLNITGLHDRVFLDLSVVKGILPSIENATAEWWDDAGHLLPMERPDRLTVSLIGFGKNL